MVTGSETIAIVRENIVHVVVEILGKGKIDCGSSKREYCLVVEIWKGKDYCMWPGYYMIRKIYIKIVSREGAGQGSWEAMFTYKFNHT